MTIRICEQLATAETEAHRMICQGSINGIHALGGWIKQDDPFHLYPSNSRHYTIQLSSIDFSKVWSISLINHY